MSSALDISLSRGSGWAIEIAGTDVSRLISGANPEWAITQLSEPAPSVQIGSIDLDITISRAQVGAETYDLTALRPNQLVQGFWQGEVLWTARIDSIEITAWDAVGDAVQAVSITLTDKLGQALAATKSVPSSGVPLGQRLTWPQFVRQQLTRPSLRGNSAIFAPNDILIAPIEATLGADAFSYSRPGDTNPVLLAAGVAASHGYALWCNANEQVELRSLRPSGPPLRRYAIEQIISLLPERSAEPPADAVELNGEETFTRLIVEEPETIRESQTGPAPAPQQPEGNTGETQNAEPPTITVSRTERTIFPYSRNTGTQRETFFSESRAFTLPAGDPQSLTWILTEIGERTTSYRRSNQSGAGYMESAVVVRQVNAATVSEERSGLITVPGEGEFWEYDRDTGLPTRHTVDKVEVAVDTRQEAENPPVIGYVSERTVETWNRTQGGQYRYSRRVFRAGQDTEGAFDPRLVLSESERTTITADQIPSPPTEPVTRALETESFSARAEIRGGTGPTVQVNCPGITRGTARQFCELYALIEGQRRTIYQITRPLQLNETLQPLTREDVHNKALIRDGISLAYSGEGSIELSYQGWLAGRFSPPIMRPRRTVPTGALDGALEMLAIAEFSCVVDIEIDPIPLIAIGGIPPYEFSASLPAGLSIVGSNIVGTPTVAYAGPAIEVTVTDDNLDTDSVLWDLTVLAEAPTPAPPIRLAFQVLSANQQRTTVTVPGQQIARALSANRQRTVINYQSVYLAMGLAEIVPPTALGMGNVLFTLTAAGEAEVRVPGANGQGVFFVESATIFLANWEGTNGQTTYTTEDVYARNIVFLASAEISTAQAKWGSSSLYLPDSAVRFAHTPSLEIGLADFHIEGWLYVDDTGDRYLFYHPGDGINPGLDILYRRDPLNDDYRIYIAYNDNFIEAQAFDLTNFAVNTWYHWVVQRVYNVGLMQYEIGIGFDGVVFGSGVASGDNDIQNPTEGDWYIGGWDVDTNFRPNGYYDGTRIVIGNDLPYAIVGETTYTIPTGPPTEYPICINALC